MKNKIKIISVRIEHAADTSPNTSCLGTYSDSNDTNDYAIIVSGQHKGRFACEIIDDEIPSRSGREYRFFLPCFENYKGIEESEIRKYCLQDFERMESLNNGHWYYMGVIAKAEITLNNNIIQTIHSGGLWGIESDMDNSELSLIQGEQLNELKSELQTIGFSERAIKFAFKNHTIQDK